MRTRSSVLLYLTLALGVPLLAGCDSARQGMAEAIRPATAAEVAGTLREQIAKGEFAKAAASGAAWLEDKRDPSGAIAWETAKAAAQAGKVDDAIRFAGMAVQGGAVEPVRLMSEPMLEPLRVDPRLAALAAGMGTPVNPVPAAAMAAVQSVQAHAPSASPTATIGAGGIHASAGDVSVTLPD